MFSPAPGPRRKTLPENRQEQKKHKRHKKEKDNFLCLLCFLCSCLPLFLQKPAFPFLEIEQMLFTPQAASIPSKFPALIHDAMAGNQDRNAVRTVGMTNRALSGSRADALREFLVRARLAVRYSEQLVP